MNGELYESLNLTTPTRSDLVTLTGTRVPTAGVVDLCLDECLVDSGSVRTLMNVST